MTDIVREIEQLLAIVAADDAERDPVVFARQLGFEPDPWQADVLRSKAPQLLLNNSRQAGKSTVAAIAALHMATYKPKSLQLLISPTERQSKELFRTVMDLVERLPVKPRLDEENVLSLQLQNRSRIVALPSNPAGVRGYANVARIIEDEAAFVGDDMANAVSPMLAVSGGQYWMMSTPNGRRGHFFEAWERGGGDWARVHVTASQVSRIDPAWLARKRDELTRAGNYALYQQEYEGAFVHGAQGRVYAGFDETRNVVDEVPPCSHHLLALDYGVVDPTSYTVLGWNDHDPTIWVVCSFKVPHQSPSTSAEQVQALDAQFHFQRIVGDVGGLGKGYAEEAIQRFQIAIEPADKTGKLGFVALLNGDLGAGRVRMHRTACAQLIAELLELAWKPDVDGHARTVEDPALANHCTDGLLYGWRATTAFLNRPAVAAPQTPEERIRVEMGDYWRRKEQASANRREEALYLDQ